MGEGGVREVQKRKFMPRENCAKKKIVAASSTEKIIHALTFKTFFQEKKNNARDFAENKNSCIETLNPHPIPFLMAHPKGVFKGLGFTCDRINLLVCNQLD